MLWFNGLTALSFIIFGTIFGINLFRQASKINARALKFMGLNILFSTWCYSGYVIDFISLIILDSHVNNVNGWIGIFSGIWLGIALIFAIYVGSEMLFPKYKKILTAIYIIICLIFAFFLIFETDSSLGFFYPPDNTSLINYYVHFSSPLGIIVIIYYVSLFFFLGIGFLYQSSNSKGLIRKKFFYLGVAEIIFIPTSILELLPISSFYFLISRPVLIIVPILVYLGFREESIVKENNLIVEQKLFRLVENSFEEFKSSFLRRASHELKTPLIPIKGNLDYLLNENVERLEEDVIFRLKEMKHGYNILETVIQNFLFSLELEGNGIELNKRKIDLASLIRNHVKVYEDLINLRNHKLSLNIQDNILVLADKVRMERVIDNLLINAIKFTPSGGNIKISSTIERFHVMISVEDNGIGIIDKDKRKIFQKFGKIERYGKGWDIISEGSGLGLFICKKIIQNHGGKIWVSSEGKNKGTRVSFKIPVF